MAAVNVPIAVPEHVEAQRKTQCPNNVLLAIYGKPEDKKKAYDHSLTRCGMDAPLYIFPSSRTSWMLLVKAISLIKTGLYSLHTGRGFCGIF